MRCGLVLVGAVGFEPTDGGSKGRCLTTWRRPKNLYCANLYGFERFFKKFWEFQCFLDSFHSSTTASIALCMSLSTSILSTFDSFMFILLNHLIPNLKILAVFSADYLYFDTYQDPPFHHL